MGLLLDKDNQMCFLVGKFLASFMGLLERQGSFFKDYIAGGTLKNVIHDLSTPLTWLQRLHFAKDITAGMVRNAPVGNEHTDRHAPFSRPLLLGIPSFV